MFDIKLALGIITSIIAVVCFYPYFRDIFKNKTQPHIYTWLIWTILQTIGTIASVKDGAGYGALALGFGALICGIIFLLSFKYGTKNISKFDLYCLLASFVALALYLFLDNALYAVVAVVLIDFIGFLPTYRKGWQEPDSETASTFFLSGIANFLSFFALNNVTLITSLYICSLFFTNTTFVLMILYRKNKLKNK